MVAKVHGQFMKWAGDLRFDQANPGASRVEVQIDAASIDTREPQRDGHLRSADFLDVEKHPHIRFRSTHVEAVSEAAYHVVGDLTIHGTTKPVVLKLEYSGRVRDPWGGERAGFTAKTSIDRKDFGLTWNKVVDAGGVMVGDKIEITIEVEAVRGGS
jgi:polyisoprenoid-binding protein YceI